jgi:O-methyltransferase
VKWLRDLREEIEVRLATRHDRERRRILRAAAPYTMVGKRRLVNACVAVAEADRLGVAGAIVECGVWRGGCAAAMAAESERRGIARALWLFDSFEGLPQPAAEDGMRARQWMHDRERHCIADIRDVERLLFEEFGIARERVHIRKGWFADTIRAAKAQIGAIAVLRLDGDWYESTKTCLDHLYPLVSDGGLVIIDDYGYWEGCRRATDEFLSTIPPVELTAIDGCGVFFRKSEPCVG